MLRVEKLKSIVNQSYSKKHPGGLASYIERLQTTLEGTREDALDKALEAILETPQNHAFYRTAVRPVLARQPISCADHSREWRNWQTRRIQVPVSERT